MRKNLEKSPLTVSPMNLLFVGLFCVQGRLDHLVKQADHI